MGGGVTSFLSFWAEDDAGGRGHVWQQVVGNPHRASCNDLVVCASGAYPYRGNVAAPVAFAFTNPYPDRPVTFVERNGPDDTCTDPCTNNAVEVAPSAATTVPASSLGYYYVETGPPRLNGLSWYEGDPARYRSLPPDETLAPFIVEVP
jgi:hypothetical protein